MDQIKARFEYPSRNVRSTVPIYSCLKIPKRGYPDILSTKLILQSYPRRTYMARIPWWDVTPYSVHARERAHTRAKSVDYGEAQDLDRNDLRWNDLSEIRPESSLGRLREDVLAVIYRDCAIQNRLASAKSSVLR